MAAPSMAAEEQPGLIRWGYLRYVAAGFAVLAAAILLGNVFFLNFIHVMCGVMWTGIDVFVGFVLGPSLRQVDLPARRALSTRLLPRMLFLMPSLAIITGTAGYFLAKTLGFFDAALSRQAVGRRRAGPHRHSHGAGAVRVAADQPAHLPRIAEGAARSRQTRPSHADICAPNRAAGLAADRHHRGDGALRHQPVTPFDPGKYADSLPVAETLSALKVALAGKGAAVLEAPPGAGKTTLVPLALLDEPWLAGKRILMLEPRRLATRAAARRMAQMLGESAGETVGFRTRLGNPHRAQRRASR
jgi:hypothetical protein